LIRAAFFDVDGTLTSEHTWKGLLDYFQVRGLRKTTLAVYMATHYPLYFLRKMNLISEGNFRAPWTAHLAWFVRGYSPEQANEVWAWAVDHYLVNYWREDTRKILSDHLQRGDLVMLVSSGPLPLVQYIARELGAQHAVGTRYEVRDGRFTGKTSPPVVIDEQKARVARQYLQTHKIEIDMPGSSAYADSIADLQLLEMVGNPVAVYPDDRLRAIAQQRGWRIHPD